MILQIIVNTLTIGSLYALIATGFNVLYCTTRFFNLAYGTFLAVGGYAFVLLVNRLHGYTVMLAVLASLITGLIGWSTNKMVFKKLRDNNSSALVMMVASLGLMIVLQSLLSIFFGNQFKMLSVDYALPLFKFFSTTITTPQILIIVMLLITVIALYVLLQRTKFGIQVRAVGDDVQLAQATGIDTNKIISRIFFLSAVIAGFTGILIGLDTGIEPLMGFSWLIKGVIAAIIGTIGYWYGGILGAFLLAFIEQIAAWQFSGEWKDAVSYASLIIFLVILPNGIFESRRSGR